MLDAWLARDLARLRAVTVEHIAKTLDDLRQQLQSEPDRTD